MPATTSFSRILRLQFSLRALLLLMAVVGIGLIIFRWPWVETKQEKWMMTSLLYNDDGPGFHQTIRKDDRWHGQWRNFAGVFGINDIDEYRITTTYRRGWNGKPQRNGVRQYWRLSKQAPPVLVVEKQYVDDDLRRVNYFDDKSGELNHSEGRLNGVPHGNSYHGAKLLGTYVRGKRTGVWHGGYTYSRIDLQKLDIRHGYVTKQESYRDGVLHGEWLWNDHDGRILQSAKYDAGQLVEWNGLPKRQAIQGLLRRCQIPEATIAKLEQPAADAIFVEQSRGNELSTWSLKLAGQPVGLQLHARRYEFGDSFVLIDPASFEFSTNAPLLEQLVESALARDETLMVRSQQLFLVKISAIELETTK